MFEELLYIGLYSGHERLVVSLMPRAVYWGFWFMSILKGTLLKAIENRGGASILCCSSYPMGA
jgi:hypothetical protein